MDTVETWSQDVALAGFSRIPNAVLDQQHALDLSSTELVALLHLLRYATGGSLARPDVARISEAMDLGATSVLRCFKALEDLGYVERKGDDGYELSGLVARLDVLLQRQPTP